MNTDLVDISEYPIASQLVSSLATTTPVVEIPHDPSFYKTLELLFNPGVHDSFSLSNYWNHFSLPHSTIEEMNQFLREMVVMITRYKRLFNSLFNVEGLTQRKAHYLEATLFAYVGNSDTLGTQICANTLDGDFTINAVSTMHNCPESEGLLERSIHDNKTVLFNGFLLMKKFGYSTALALENRTTSESTFVRGAWYSPADLQLKEQVRSALNSNVHTSTINRGSWNFIRDTSRHLDSSQRNRLLSIAQEHASYIRI